MVTLKAKAFVVLAICLLAQAAPVAEPAPAAPAAKPADADAKPVEAAAKPAEADAKPAEADAKPVEADAKPVEAAAKPAEADAKPAAAKPAEAAAKPAEADAKPAEADAKPVEAAAKPAEEATMRRINGNVAIKKALAASNKKAAAAANKKAEAAAKPAEAAANPAEAAAKPVKAAAKPVKAGTPAKAAAKPAENKSLLKHLNSAQATMKTSLGEEKQVRGFVKSVLSEIDGIDHKKSAEKAPLIKKLNSEIETRAMKIDATQEQSVEDSDDAAHMLAPYVAKSAEASGEAALDSTNVKQQKKVTEDLRRASEIETGLMRATFPGIKLNRKAAPEGKQLGENLAAEKTDFLHKFEDSVEALVNEDQSSIDAYRVGEEKVQDMEP